MRFYAFVLSICFARSEVVITDVHPQTQEHFNLIPRGAISTGHPNLHSVAYMIALYCKLSKMAGLLVQGAERSS